MTNAKPEHFGSWLSEKRFLELVSVVESRARLAGSPDHGAHHWRLVAWTGAQLLETMPDADHLVVLLFALFHDSQRENEYDDPDHGARGATLASELVPMYVPELAQERLELLVKACQLHTTAGPTTEPTLGICWDSDRLNLWRVGTEPSPSYLSTTEAKDAQRIQWAYDLQNMDFTWSEIFTCYRLGSSDEPKHPKPGETSEENEIVAGVAEESRPVGERFGQIPTVFLDRFEGDFELPWDELPLGAMGHASADTSHMEYVVREDERGLYLEYYVTDRFVWGDIHERIYADGELVDDLETIQPVIWHHPDGDPEEERRAYEENNRQVADALRKSGLFPEHDINAHLRTNPDLH